VIGTHNSYHREPHLLAKPYFDLLLSTPFNYYYSHASLSDQLSHQTVRSLELDLHADYDNPGRLSDPLIYRMAGLEHSSEWKEQMLERTAKVLHVPDADVDASCFTIRSCLAELRAWSDAHPTHVPIIIDLEFKTVEDRMVSLGGAKAEPWNATNLELVDEELVAGLGRDKIIIPDDIRLAGKKSSDQTLEEAVLTHGWPTLDDSRGKFIFVMDNNPTPQPSLRDAYRADGHENLEGRVIFTNSLEGEADAAFIKRNDPTGNNVQEIQDLVKKGYLIRTRADEPIGSVLSGDANAFDQLETALETGAQVVSTDWPSYGMATRYNSDYVAKLPHGGIARCNPINAPDSCHDAVLESSGGPGSMAQANQQNMKLALLGLQARRRTLNV
jgi:hypothetical protein